MPCLTCYFNGKVKCCSPGQRYESHPEEDREAWLKKSNEKAKEEIEQLQASGGIPEKIGMEDGERFVPTMVSVAIDMRTGEILSVGYSGRDHHKEAFSSEIAEKLQQRIDAVKEEAANDPTNKLFSEKRSYRDWSVSNCAEVDAVNKALMKDKTLEIKDIFINTRRVETKERKNWIAFSGDYAPPCENCQRTFHDAVFLPFEGIQNIYDQKE